MAKIANINAVRNINNPNWPKRWIGLSSDLSKKRITNKSNITLGILDNPYLVFPAVLGWWCTGTSVTYAPSQEA